jgi:hypothetical protein
MERIRGLINKLQQQCDQKADPSDMLGTVKLLQFELTAISSLSKREGSSKVAVVFPAGVNTTSQQVIAEPQRASKEYEQVPQMKTSEVKMPEVKETAPVRRPDNSEWLLDPVEEVPTLAHQKEIKELNDIIGQQHASLNDKLKTEKKELFSLLKEGPVKDLKKAIGINDRFVFLHELFRGDEAMYERSIKTINNFRIYPEAEYWIERELKVKLGWDEKKPAVQQFSQLVRRRFL